MVDTKKIKYCAELSDLVYKDNITSENLIIKHVIDEVSFCIFKKNKEIYLVFRGSDNTSNWLLDFNYLKVYDKNLQMDIHRGYKKTAKKIFNYLKDIFLNKLFLNFDFTFSGHSLGGAIAILVALYFKKCGLNIKNIITFGSPKITNYKGAKKITKSNILTEYNFVRVINDKDIVNLLPPNSIIGWWKGRYQHFGKELILLDNNKVDINPPKKVLNNNKSLFFNIDEDSIKEHRIKNYIKKLNIIVDNGFEVIKNTFKI